MSEPSASQPTTAAPDLGPVMELKAVSKFYQSQGSIFGGPGQRVTALSDVSLSFQPGEIFGLVGESGSGKTTCGRLMVGLERASQGRLLLEGDDITGLKGRALREYRRKVQIIFQDPYQSLNPQLSILDSVAEPLITNRACRPAEREGRVLAALKAVGLSPPESFAYRFPHQLSGGQRQRVAIARAMIIEPRLLVADEPTSMLDASYSAQIFDILLKVRQRFGTTIVLITHSLAAARYLCDRIAVIYHGHLMEMGTADQVITEPRHPYTQALIDATPKFGECGDVPRYATLLSPERPATEHAGCVFFRRCARAHLTRCSRQAPEWRGLDHGRLVACHYAESAPEPSAEAGACLLPEAG
ncbi:MAG: oligopeptide/dipeptide ABC transporter ATP-binding protein [Thermodesulfobacteriota bacterium]